MISSPLAVCTTEGHSPLQFDTSFSSPPSISYGLQSRGTVASQLAGLTVTSPSLAEAQQAGKAGCESPAESNSFKKTRRGKRAGKNLRLRNAESEFRRRSVDTMHSGDDSPRSWTPRSQLELPGTPRTVPGTPRTAPVTPMGPRGTPLTPRMAPISPPAAGSTVWAPHRSHVQAKSPWDSPATHVPSPLSYERTTTPDHSFMSSLNPMDSAYCGRADAAWADGTDEPRSARIAQLQQQQQQQQLRPTGSAPSTLTRRLQFTEGAAWPPSRHSIAEPSRLSCLPRIDSARAMTQADELGGHPLSRVPTWEALADAARQLEESRRQLNLPSPTAPASGMSFRPPSLGTM